MHRFSHLKRGSVAVEMALVSIVLAMLITGGFEAARVVLLEQKLDRTTTAVADLVAREETIATGDLTDIFSAAKKIMSPFDVNGAGAVYVSVVKFAVSPAKPTIVWQKKIGGTLTNASKIGSGAGTTATLPTGFTLDTNEYVVIAEVYYTYMPVMGFDMFRSKLSYQAAYSRPRLSDYPVLSQ